MRTDQPRRALSSAYGRQVFRALETRQWVTDLVGGCAFFFVLWLLVYGMGAGGSGWLIGLIDVLVLAVYALALVFRRWAPPLALALAWVGALIQMGTLRDVQPGNIAILLVLYAVGCYGSRLVRWLGLISAGLGALLASVYLLALLPMSRYPNAQPPSIGVVLFTIAASLAVLALPWTLGMLSRSRHLSRESKARALDAQREAELAEYAVVVEQERNRIARDMHDVVAHSLAVVIAQADGARYAARSNLESAENALGTIATTAREALADVRLLLTELRHSEAEGPQPTIHDLEKLISQLRSTGLSIEVSSSGDIVPMSAGHQIAVYRIVQEALTNALRHGDSRKHVLLQFEWSDEGVRVRVSSAAARRAPQPTGSVGHGIPGMRERALLTGGTFAAAMSADDRFEVSAWIPSGVAAAANKKKDS